MIFGFAFRKSTAAFTKFNKLQIKAVPIGATVSATCKAPKGKKCPAKSFTKKNAFGTVNLSKWVNEKLAAGTRLTVTVTKPGAFIGAVKTLTVAKKKSPTHRHPLPAAGRHEVRRLLTATRGVESAAGLGDRGLERVVAGDVDGEVVRALRVRDALAAPCRGGRRRRASARCPGGPGRRSPRGRCARSRTPGPRGRPPWRSRGPRRPARTASRPRPCAPSPAARADG